MPKIMRHEVRVTNNVFIVEIYWKVERAYSQHSMAYN